MLGLRAKGFSAESSYLRRVNFEDFTVFSCEAATHMFPYRRIKLDNKLTIRISFSDHRHHPQQEHVAVAIIGKMEAFRTTSISCGHFFRSRDFFVKCFATLIRNRFLSRVPNLCATLIL